MSILLSFIGSCILMIRNAKDDQHLPTWGIAIFRSSINLNWLASLALIAGLVVDVYNHGAGTGFVRWCIECMTILSVLVLWGSQSSRGLTRASISIIFFAIVSILFTYAS